MNSHWDVKAILTTLFMVYAVCYSVTRRHLDLSTSLGTARGVGFLAAAFGLCTFSATLASANPSVLGRTEWSGLDIVTHVYDGTVRFSLVALDVVSSYLLLLFAIAALCLPRPRKPLLIVSVLGIICSSWALEMGHSTLFDWFTTGSIPRTVSYGPAMYAIEIVMSVLLLVSVNGAENGL
jgi:hypothetical protein